MDIYAEIVRLRGSGRPFVAATIVRIAGSSPRDAGAKMLVFPDGSISGTIGGGTFEKLVIDDCLKIFETGQKTLLKKYRFTPDGPDSTGMVCGGEAEVYMELHGKPDQLFIFGGGHIGQALSKLAADLDFAITIVDDRKKILEQYRSSIKTILTNGKYENDFPTLDKNSYVVIVTKSHVNDKAILQQALRYDCAYIGMIGSKNKVAKIKSELVEQGMDKGKLDSVNAPIGLDIGAEGPEEIAISIAAELIAVRRKEN